MITSSILLTGRGREPDLVKGASPKDVLSENFYVLPFLASPKPVRPRKVLKTLALQCRVGSTCLRILCVSHSMQRFFYLFVTDLNTNKNLHLKGKEKHGANDFWPTVILLHWLALD